jgi:DNA-binding response OmpR family regulator
MSESECPPVFQKKLVLVIEDDPVLLKTLAGWYASAGCRVMTASNGAIGLTHFQQIRPDLVVTDIIMPEREGVETILAMKAQDRSVPILAISGGGRLGPGEFLSLALGLGADSVLAKPFRSKELLTISENLLDKAAKAA